MKDYRIMSTNTADQLSDVVNKYFQQGWELYGDPFVKDGIFCQAMIKK